MGTSQANQFANVRSLTCVASDPEKNPKIENLMQQLIDHDLGTNYPKGDKDASTWRIYHHHGLHFEKRSSKRKRIEDAYQAGSLHYK